MPRRKPQRNAGVIGLPLHETISELALAGDFCRTELAVVLQNRAERNRHRRDRETSAPVAHLVQLQVRERRDEIEIPLRIHQCRLLNVSASNASTAITSLRAASASCSVWYSSWLITPASRPISS